MKSVAVAPGATAFTVMPRPARPAASERVKEISAAFDMA